MTLQELAVRCIRADAEALATAARHDPAAAVPTCPGWTMPDLVNHLGRLHRWVGTIVHERSREAVDVRRFHDGPAEMPARIAWFEEGAEVLAEGLAGIDEDVEVWNWRHGVQPVRFWMRRAPLETAVHRWDGQHAVGAETPVDTELAVHGVDEIGDLWLPLWRPSALEVSTTESMHLHCTDTEGEWMIRFTPDGAVTTRQHAKGDLAVRGSASDLFLLMWNRVSAERFETFGDASLLQRFAEHVHI